MQKFHRELGFYSCTVSSFEQYTLARFLSRGHFEKHINRMRKLYRTRRVRVVQMLRQCAAAPWLTILEQDAGLHFLLQVDTEMTDRQLVDRLADRGIRVRALSDYFHDGSGDRHCLVVNYSGLKEEQLQESLEILADIM